MTDTDWRGNDPWRLRTHEAGFTYWENTKTGETELPKCAYVRGDLPTYISPVTGKPIDGRRERREDLKKHGCVEVDPPAKKNRFINPRFAKKHGFEICGEEADKFKPKKRIDPLSTL